MEIKGKTIGTGKPLLCVPVMESNKEEIIDELRTLAKSEADIVEWRIDTFVDYKNYNAVREVFAAAAECMKEKIFLYTFRTKKQGGMGELAPDELNDLHDLAAESGCVDLLDLEFFEEEHPARKIRKLHLRVPHDVSIDYGCSIRGNNSLGSDGNTQNFILWILVFGNKVFDFVSDLLIIRSCV